MILDWILSQKEKGDIARKADEIWMGSMDYKVMLYKC